MRAIPEVSGLDVVFPTRAMELLPPMHEIPDEFKRHDNKWVRCVSTWFFKGLANAKWTPKPGVDTKKALLAVKACIGDFEPSHEHKEAGCAYLLSEWFEDVSYTAAN